MLYERLYEDGHIAQCELFLRQDSVKWSTFFKYLGSNISGFEGLISFLEDAIVASTNKVGGAVGSACRSAVALPMSQLVRLHHSLVGPITLLNGVAWFPSLAKGGPWYSLMCKQWGGCGFSTAAGQRLCAALMAGLRYLGFDSLQDDPEVCL